MPRSLGSVALFVVACGSGVGLAVVAGVADAPGGFAVAVTLVAAALSGWAAGPLVRKALASFRDGRGGGAPVSGGRGTAAVPRPRSHRRVPLASPVRIGIVAGAVVLLGLICWIQPGEPGRVLFGAACAVVGLFVYALPLLPLFGLVPSEGSAPSRASAPTGASARPGVFPPSGVSAPSRASGASLPSRATSDSVPWRALWTERKALAIVLAAAKVGRDAVLGRAAGVVLASVAMFHLSRGAPGLEESAYQLAGGLLGIVVATPLAGILSPAGAFGLLVAVLVGVATVTAGRLYRPLGRYPALAALALVVVAPVAAAGVTNRVGYRYFLGADGVRVVVIAGLSLHHRHETYDANVALSEVSAPMRPVLRKGFPVTDRADGARVAAALADPAKAAADGFPDGGLTLRTGECFTFVGGTSNFRYTVPCNGEHTGEVFYVGRLPFTGDPGTEVRTAAARGACEKAYGDYLGAPYGVSSLPMEPPALQQNLVACLFAALGPWPLRGTRLVAALQQKVDWSPAAGCTVEPGLRITASQPGQVCVAPGRAVGTTGSAPFVIDAEFQPVGKGAGSGRVGAACVGADAGTGYFATVGGDGVLALTKYQGGARTPMGTAGKARSSPSPQTNVTQVQMTCRPSGTAVQIVVAAGKGRELTVTDAAGVTALSPRLVVEAAEAPVTATVTLFSAKLV